MKNNMKIKYLIMDVDGTLTDGKIYISPSGELMKAFNIKDGYGIHDILLTNNIRPIIMTGRESAIVLNRCREIGIEDIYQGVTDKEKKLKELFSDFSMIAYIGDDINDIKCMRIVKDNNGVVGCPADAVDEVKEISDYISRFNGGDGAVRDFIDWIID